jgi:hypothetical protein
MVHHPSTIILGWLKKGRKMTIRHRVNRRFRRFLSYDLFLVLSIIALLCWGVWQYSVVVQNPIWAFYPPVVEGPLPEGPFSKYRKVKPPDSPPVAIDMTVPVSWLQVLATSSAVHLQAIIEEAKVLDRRMVRWNWEAVALCDRMVKESMVI